MGFVSVAVIGSCMFAAYWFTRPQELVWWTSPPIGLSGNHRFRVLIPNGWVVNSSGPTGKKGKFAWTGYYAMFPNNRRPMWLRWLYSQDEDGAGICFDVTQVRSKLTGLISTQTARHEAEGQPHCALRTVVIRQEGLTVNLGYYRKRLPSFNRTYKQICDSLTIE